jgi:hypothetical protein
MHRHVRGGVPLEKPEKAPRRKGKREDQDRKKGPKDLPAKDDKTADVKGGSRSAWIADGAIS